MIQTLFIERTNKFAAYPAIKSELNLVDENETHTHMLEYLHLCDPETILSNKTFNLITYLSFISI
jgi:hypothetical protein